ncbi:MAG TPA: choice-of-anchor B family protein [Candidatus Limnocylindrales bacterium]|nr:choice-of-anchor B family protein [Candidatus Limnocylindrales bacterium]
MSRSLLLVLACCLLASPAGAQVSKNITLLAHLNQHPGYSACWSYVHHDGREYAVLGTTDGTAIVNVTNPATSYEVAFFPGLASLWREMKQYRTYIYVATEATGGGIQIINMANPEVPVLVGTYATGINHEHTLEVDSTRALLYCNGTRFDATQTGMRILSLANPASPVDLGGYMGDYVHDCFPRGDTLFASCIYGGVMRVLNVANPASIYEITSWTYPKAFTHSAETSKDGKYLYVCDELNYGTMKAFDIHDLMAHPQINEITVNPLAIVHNIHVKADTGFVAYYTEGVRLFDLSDPTLPAEFGYYDTYAGYSGGFHGVWEVAPRFPSGTFIAGDMTSGLYVFRTNPSYGILKLRVVNPSMTAIQDADVTALGETDSTRTQSSGMTRLALGPGSHTLRIKKFGYKGFILPVSMTKGAHDSVLVQLQPEPLSTVTGVIRRAPDLAALEDADVEMEDTPLETASTSGGNYTLIGVPGATYLMICDRAGYVPIERVTTVQPGVSKTVDFTLQKAAWYDSCDADRGWSLSAAGDGATSGMWERADPVGTSQGTASPAPRPAPAWNGSGSPRLAPQHEEPAEGTLAPGPVQPEDDHSPGADGFCFVTGNGTPGRPPGDSDIDFGNTTLTSPALNMTGMADPYIHFARWYFMNSPGEPDSFVVDISGNGVSWVTIRSTLTSEPFWRHETFRVRDYITPTSAVRVRFVAQDQPPEGVVEAAVDDFEFYDAALTPTGVGDPVTAAPEMAVSAPCPNPAGKSASLTLSLPAPARARVAVYDLSGREIRTLLDGVAAAGPTTLVWDGKDARGRQVGSGVYWIRAQAAGRGIERKVVWVR